MAPRETFVKDEQSGVCRLLPLPIEASLPGKGSCIRCGSSFSVVQWPEDAYFSVDVHGGTVWAWNTTYLPALRARVAGDRVLERQLALSNGYLHYFLARIPKQAVVKRNRTRLLRTLDDWLCRSKLLLRVEIACEVERLRRSSTVEFSPGADMSAKISINRTK
jgi:hypothetical protein